MATHAIAMPRLGMTMEEGTVVLWPIAIGGAVAKGQIVLVIETEKAESEIESHCSGTLRHVYVEPGEVAPCGALLAAVTDSADEAFDAQAFAAAHAAAQPAGAGAKDASDASPAARTPRAGPRDAVATAAHTTAADAPARKPIAPAARALARKLGLDPLVIEGSGPNGRVTSADVEAFAARRAQLVTVEAGVGLEVLRSGAGDPVALLPGFGTDVSAFALQSAPLAERFSVIGINPRGVSGSDAPAQDAYAVARAADDVAAVLDRPTHLIGASLGAAVALEVALRHPGRVRSLVLVTPFVEATPRLLSFARAWSRAAGEASPEAVAEILAPWLFGDGLLGDEKARARTLRGLAQTLRRAPAAVLDRQAKGLADWSGSRSADLAKIAVPTLVLVAGDDLLTPAGREIAAAIPGARCEVLDGCGHALAIDGAAAVTKSILEHLGGTAT